MSNLSQFVGGIITGYTQSATLATNVVARNAQTIMGLAEDLTVDNKNAFISLQFLNSSWRLVE